MAEAAVSGARKTPRYGHAQVAMCRVASDDQIQRAGDFCWDFEGDMRFIEMALPRPTDFDPNGWIFSRIPVRRGGNVAGKHWGWDGDEDKPTLQPSVHAIGHWHGWIHGGQMVEA